MKIIITRMGDIPPFIIDLNVNLMVDSLDSRGFFKLKAVAGNGIEPANVSESKP